MRARLPARNTANCSEELFLHAGAEMRLLFNRAACSQHRFDGGPFIIAEFVAHDSRLRFRSLNQVSGAPSTRDGPWRCLLTV